MPFALALLAVGGLAFANGGHDAPAWNAAVVGLGWVAAAGLLLREVSLSRLERATLAAFGGLTLWAALSVVWSVSVPLSVLDAQRLLVLAVALAAFLAVGPGRGTLEGVAAAATAASVWNLATRAGANGDTGEDALPLGYGNGVAIFAGIGLLLALGLARERRLWLLACVPLAAALLRADSRGALVAVLSGAAVAVVVERRPVHVRPWTALAVIAGASALGVTALAFSDERSAYWRTSLDAFADRPLLGSGAGTWVRTWLAERDVAFPARDAHGLYVETLAELGPVGLALVVAALALPLVAAVRARERPYVPAAAGAYAAFALHAGVDWDLELTAVAVAGIACGAFLLAAAPAARRRGARSAVAAVGAAGVLAAALLPGNALVSLARESLRAGDPVAAEHRAELASRLAPWSAEAWRLRGEAQRALGDPEAAAASFREGVERDERDVELWLALARVEEGEERRRALDRARRLNPLGVAAR